LHKELEKIQVACNELRIEPNAESVSKIVRKLYPGISQTEVVELVDGVLASIFGLGRLEELLFLPNLTDILVNRFDDIWIDKGNGLEKTGIKFESEAAAQEFAKRIATRGHRRLDESQPFVDIQTDTGLRFHAILPPISVAGVTMSIRKPSRKILTLEEMLATGNLDENTFHTLTQIIDQQLSFLISGGTGSGKTTLLAAMLSRVETNQRILVIEDSTELSILHPHVVSVQARTPNSEGAGSITMSDLVRQALRMRPDRIVVGEVRGSEVRDLLLALNTGHQGGATTIHANRAASVPTRIEALGLVAGLPRDAIHTQMYSAFDVVIQMKDSRKGRRGVAEFAEFTRAKDGTVIIQPLIQFRKINLQSLNQEECVIRRKAP
jgi:pilus assembly protein CpaF